MLNRWILPSMLTLVLAMASLPAFASNHNSSQTILLVSDYDAPASLGGPVGGRDDDDKLVYFLGGGDPATPGFVDFGNGVPGATNETLLVPSLGYTVNVDGMGGAWKAAENPFGIPIAGPSFPRKLPDNSAFDMVVFSLGRSGDYRNDFYRDVSLAGGGTGTADIFGRTVADSWNGLEKPLLTFNGSFGTGSGGPAGTISWRAGWSYYGSVDVGAETSTKMEIPPSQLPHPFFDGLTMTDDPEVVGGKQVELYDWTYTQDQLNSGEYANGWAPLPTIVNGQAYSRAPQVSRRDSVDPTVGEPLCCDPTWTNAGGPVPGVKIVSGFGGTNANGGGGYILDIPKGTDFNAPDEFGVFQNNPSGTDVPFGIAGARRVKLPSWGYSFPVVDAVGSGNYWGQFQTAEYFSLVKNVIAEMLLNPDGASAPDGDFDLDGDVDGADFLFWQRELGDAANLALWEGNFGTIGVGPAVGAGTGAVPEPSSIALVVVSALALVGGNRRRRL